VGEKASAKCPPALSQKKGQRDRKRKAISIHRDSFAWIGKVERPLKGKAKSRSYIRKTAGGPIDILLLTEKNLLKENLT